jgi:SAM-dependent methyltransferase
MNPDSPPERNLRRPHPLALALIDVLRPQRGARVLEVGSGSGRNTTALRDAGLHVHAIPDSATPSFAGATAFDAALSTHALQHGNRETIASLVHAIARSLKGDAPLYAAFGSKSDARFGKGTRVEADTFAPLDGDERGVAHTYFDEPGIRELLAPYFEIESLEEQNVDDVVGRWAHAERPSGMIHWIVRARRRRE